MGAKVVRRIPNGSMERWSPPGLASHEQPIVDAVDPELSRGYDDGFREGRAEGLREAQRHMQATLQLLENLAANAHRPLECLDERLEDELCRLSVAVARQVIRRELNTDPDQIAGVIREVRKSLGAVVGQLRIGVHPEDAALVRRLFADQQELSSVEVEEDPTISRGGCKIATETSFVDATVETRIAKIAVQLLGDERDAHGGTQRVTSDHG